MFKYFIVRASVYKLVYRMYLLHTCMNMYVHICLHIIIETPLMQMF